MRHSEDRQIELLDDDDWIDGEPTANSWLGSPSLHRHPALLAASRLEHEARDHGILEEEDL